MPQKINDKGKAFIYTNRISIQYQSWSGRKTRLVTCQRV